MSISHGIAPKSNNYNVQIPPVMPSWQFNQATPKNTVVKYFEKKKLKSPKFYLGNLWVATNFSLFSEFSVIFV